MHGTCIKIIVLIIFALHSREILVTFLRTE